MALSGRVCLVTGATRGIGKGIAMALGKAGATVYITGRTLKAKPGVKIGGSLEETAKEIDETGGRCIPVACDHSKDGDIKQLFEKIAEEQGGRLDLLVNNAYSAVTHITESIGKKFYELEPTVWDEVNNVGLRNHYICSVYASRMMALRKDGLIVNVSSIGGLRYLFSVAYGIGKAAVDRMAADCAQELKSEKVTFVSIWPGLVRTEKMVDFMENNAKASAIKKMESESAEFSGRAIVHLMQDKNRMAKTGRTLIVADLANEYGFTDVDGNQPSSMRQLNTILRSTGWRLTASMIPNWVRLPGWVLGLGGNKL